MIEFIKAPERGNEREPRPMHEFLSSVSSVKSVVIVCCIFSPLIAKIMKTQAEVRGSRPAWKMKRRPGRRRARSSRDARKSFHKFARCLANLSRLKFKTMFNTDSTRKSSESGVRSPASKRHRKRAEVRRSRCELRSTEGERGAKTRTDLSGPDSPDRTNSIFDFGLADIGHRTSDQNLAGLGEADWSNRTAFQQQCLLVGGTFRPPSHKSCSQANLKRTQRLEECKVRGAKTSRTGLSGLTGPISPDRSHRTDLTGPISPDRSHRTGTHRTGTHRTGTHRTGTRRTGSRRTGSRRTGLTGPGEADRFQQQGLLVGQPQTVFCLLFPVPCSLCRTSDKPPSLLHAARGGG